MTELKLFSSAEISHSLGAELAIPLVLPQIPVHTHTEVQLLAAVPTVCIFGSSGVCSQDKDFILLTALSLVSVITPQFVNW